MLLLPSIAFAAEPPQRDVVALTVEKLEGVWRCAGAFANGKPIESQMAFASSLNGKWIEYRHLDRPPSSYGAFGMWGKGTTNALQATIFDSFGGHREFTSAGWVADELTLETADASTAKRERFIFTNPHDGELRMEYRVSRDGGEWKLGDYLNCKQDR